MNAEELRDALEKLQRELSQTTAVDDATRERLNGLVADIRRLAGTSEPPPQTPASTDQPVTNSLQGLVADFEARHPQLTSTVQQLVDRLSEIGI